MKKLIPFFTLLLLAFSSCKFAQNLNSVFDLKAPEDKNLLTVFADYESSDYCLVDLGDDFKWDDTKITFNKLLQNEKFKSWYSGLKNENWKTVGLYMPDTELGLLDGDKDFALSKGDAMIVGWNSPFEKIRIRANRFDDKECFDFYFSEKHDYNDSVELDFSAVRKDGIFNSWLAGLGGTVLVGNNSHNYSPIGFTKETVDSGNFQNQEISKIVTVNKWQYFVNIGWVTSSLMYGISIHANTYDDDTNVYYISLDEPCESITVDWNYLAQDSGFISWYSGLLNTGYGKIGLSSSKKSGWANLYDGTSNTIQLSGSSDLYVIWGTEVSYVMVHAGTDSKKVYLPSGEAQIKLTWNMLERNDDFMTWYKGLTDTSSGIYTKGLSFNKDESYVSLYQYCNNYSGVNLTSTNNDLYVVYGDKYTGDYVGLEITASDSLCLIPGENSQARYWIDSSAVTCVKQISFSTSNSSVASVDNHGLVTAKGTGFCQITFAITNYDGEVFTSFDTVSVSAKPQFERLKNFNSNNSSWYYDSLNYYSASDDGKIQAVVYQSQLYKSEDYGRNWKKVNADSSESYLSYYSVKVSHSGKAIAVSAYGKIYVSEDYGNSFYKAVIGEEKDISLYVLGVSDDAETMAYSFYSPDMKSDMLNVYQKNSGTISYSKYVRSFCMSASGQYMAYGNGSNIFYSDDYGKNINTFVFASSYKFFMTSDGLTVFYKNGSQLYKAGVKTAAVEIIDIPSSIDSDYWSVSPDGSGIAYYDYSEGKVYYSINGGDTWNSISQNINYPSGIFVTNNCSEIYLTYRTCLYRWSR